MARDQAPAAAAPTVLTHPQISLIGEIDKFAVERFLDQLGAAERAGGDVALEVTTLGGDPELARRIVWEIGAARERLGSRFLFLGKTTIYSAGITIMSAFPCADRWLTADAMLMIHGRQLDKTVEIMGPMRASLPQVESLRAEIETALALEDQGFRRLIEGSDIGFDEIAEKASANWYLPAREALRRRLVAGILGQPFAPDPVFRPQS